MIDVKNNLRGIAKLITLFAMILFSMLIYSNNEVKAEVLPDKISADNDIIFNVADLNIEGNSSASCNWNNEYNTITNSLYIKDIEQDVLNNYSKSKRQTKADIKIKIPNDIVKVEFNGVPCIIETIDNQKYIQISETLIYTNLACGTPKKDDDVKYIKFTQGEGAYTGEPRILKLYSDEEQFEEYVVYNNIYIYSENATFDYEYKIVNKYGTKYNLYGGMGGALYDVFYIQEITAYKIASMPQDINLSETYFELDVNVYQGEKIEVKNLGTLYYAGISEKENEKIYSYKNSLSNLTEPTIESIPEAELKNANGNKIHLIFPAGYEFSSDIKEQEVTGEFDSSEQTTANIIYRVTGTGNAKIDAIEIPEDDKLYEKLNESISETIDSNKFNTVILDVLDINVIEGDYQGKVNITFDVGNEHNGKEYIVGHLANGINFEYYKGTIKDGKITITVDSLSPFMISVLEEKEDTTPTAPTEQEQPTNTDDKELDETPKTGENNNITLPISIIALISLTGIVIVKKYTK